VPEQVHDAESVELAYSYLGSEAVLPGDDMKTRIQAGTMIHRLFRNRPANTVLLRSRNWQADRRAELQ
jgi:hypothetical protein